MLRNRAWCIWIGLVLFLLGGTALAFGGESFGVPVGTLFGLTGLGLIAWGWFAGRGES